MLKRTLEVLAADFVILVALFNVIQDLQWRSAYASAAVIRCGGALCSYTPSFSYGLLTQVFTMSGNSLPLSSPLTLDWVQALVYALVVLNGWLGYSVLKYRWSKRVTVGPPETSH